MGLIIFDIDGTLFDTHSAVTFCIKKVFETAKIQSTPTDQAIKTVVASGVGLHDTFQQLAPQADSDKLVAQYREIYSQVALTRTQLFAGVKETLTELQQQGHKLVVVSNKGEAAIHQALQHFKIDNLMTMVVGDRGKQFARKPNPQIYNDIIAPIFPDIAKQDTWMVGDTEADILFAQNAGIHAAWVAYGYGDAKNCHALQPKVIDHFASLTLLIKST